MNYKQIIKSDLFQLVVSKLLAFLMRFSFYTTKWKFVNYDIPEKYHEKGEPFIVALWHDRLMTAPCVWKWKKPLHVLASSHSDGQLIAKTVENFSMPAVFGSTGKGAIAAKKLIRLIRNNEYIAIIPDGPRGPRHKVALGIITISKLTKTDILPFSCCIKKYKRLKSWDKFIIAFPFNKGVLHWGEPIKYTEIYDMSDEDAISYVSNKINELSKQAFKIMNKDYDICI